jgi:tetratricopeptide (TPR) repeat protein
MVDKRRAAIGVVLVLCLIALVGFSMGPLLGGLLNATRSPSEPEVTPSPAANGAQLTQLEDQARGYEMVLQREPDNETALRGFLMAKFELIRQGRGEVKDVVEPLRKLSELNPDAAEYGILLAQSQEYSGDPEGAAQSYRKILERQPGQIQALQGLTNLLIAQNRPEAAIGLLEDTLQAAPEANQAQPGSIDETSIQLILGQVYAQQERYDEAIAIYDEAIKNSGEDFRPVLAKAMVLKQQGNMEEAEPLFAKATDLAPAAFKDQIQMQAGITPPAETDAASPPVGAEPAAAEPAAAEPAAAEPTQE